MDERDNMLENILATINPPMQPKKPDIEPVYEDPEREEAFSSWLKDMVGESTVPDKDQTISSILGKLHTDKKRNPLMEAYPEEFEAARKEGIPNEILEQIKDPALSSSQVHELIEALKNGQDISSLNNWEVDAGTIHVVRTAMENGLEPEPLIRSGKTYSELQEDVNAMTKDNRLVESQKKQYHNLNNLIGSAEARSEMQAHDDHHPMRGLDDNLTK